jgi:hypothetical protein
MSNPFALDAAPTPAAAPAPVAPAQAPVTAPVQPITQPFQTGGVVPGPMTASYDDADPFDAPAPQRPRGPRLQEMYGRLLLVIPHRLEENIPNRLDNKGGTQDRMTADVIVLDGGPISYGGKPEKLPPVPHDKVGAIPFRQDKMFISAVGLISQCREALAKKVTQGRPGMVLGRLMTGQATGDQNAPYLLTPPTDADKAIGRAYLAQVDPFA